MKIRWHQTCTMDYGIAVRNKYELFFDDEDADPLEILRLQEEENAKKKDEGVKGKDAKSLKDTKSAKNKKNNKALSSTQDQKNKPADPKDNKKVGDQPRNKPRNDDRNNRPRDNRDRDLPPRRLQQQNENRPNSGFGAPATSPQSNTEYRDRGEGRGRGRGRGGRGGGRGRGGFDRFGKREFDRQSGSDKTGIKATEKREGGGAHNWGNVKDDIDDQINPTTQNENQEFAAPTEDIENQQPTEGAVEGDGEDAPAQSEDPSASEMTLDEYKALQKKKASDFNVRKPGEGCDNSQWKKTYELKKKAILDSDEEEEETDDEDDYEDRRKQYVPIEITFGDQSRRGGSGGRGGRGGSRGGSGPRGGRGSGPRGPGMGGGRGARGAGGGGGSGRKEQAPNVEDELDFPTLGKA